MKTHTADEATLDGETPSQDLISVSNATLKIEIKPNLLCDYSLEVILSTFTPPPSHQCPTPTSHGYATDWSKEIERYIYKDRER